MCSLLVAVKIKSDDCWQKISVFRFQVDNSFLERKSRICRFFVQRIFFHSSFMLINLFKCLWGRKTRSIHTNKATTTRKDWQNNQNNKNRGMKRDKYLLSLTVAYLFHLSYGFLCIYRDVSSLNLASHSAWQLLMNFFLSRRFSHVHRMNKFLLTVKNHSRTGCSFFCSCHILFAVDEAFRVSYTCYEILTDSIFFDLSSCHLYS